MSWIKKFPEKASEFVVTRYPLWMAFVLLMMISDQAQEEQGKAALPARLLYANIGMTLFCGFTLSMTHLSSKMSMVFAGQLGYQAYNLVFNSAFQLNPFLARRMASRNLGLMAVYALFAYHADAKQRKKRGNNGANTNNGGSVAFHLIGHFLLAAFFGCFAWLLKYEKGEREAFLLHVAGRANDDGGSVEEGSSPAAADAASGGHFLLDACFWISIVLSGIFLSRKLVKYSFKAALILLASYTFYIDCDVAYWTTLSSSSSTAASSSSSSSSSPLGFSLWMQIRLISDNVAILAALLLFDSTASKIKSE